MSDAQQRKGQPTMTETERSRTQDPPAWRRADPPATEPPQHPATRARSNVRVAPSNSTLSRKERAPATRWTARETQSMVATAPPFSYGKPSGELLNDLAAGYREITDHWLRTPKQRNLLAAAYRVHGPRLLEVVRSTFADLRTSVNLLGTVRATPAQVMDPGPAASARTESGDPAPDHDGIPCPVEQCLTGVVFCQAHFPKFDPTSTIRYDRRSWPDHYPATDAGGRA